MPNRSIQVYRKVDPPPTPAARSLAPAPTARKYAPTESVVQASPSKAAKGASSSPVTQYRKASPEAIANGFVPQGSGKKLLQGTAGKASVSPQKDIGNAGSTMKKPSSIPGGQSYLADQSRGVNYTHTVYSNPHSQTSGPRMMGVSERVFVHSYQDSFLSMNNFWFYWFLLHPHSSGTASSNVTYVESPVPNQTIVQYVDPDTQQQQQVTLKGVTPLQLTELQQHFPLDRDLKVGDLLKIPNEMMLPFASNSQKLCNIEMHGGLQVLEARSAGSMLVQYIPPTKLIRESECPKGAKLLISQTTGKQMNKFYLKNLSDKKYNSVDPTQKKPEVQKSLPEESNADAQVEDSRDSDQP